MYQREEVKINCSNEFDDFYETATRKKTENSQNNVSKSSTLRLFFLKTNTSSIDA